jgi:protein-S-isoprenylcysteine O-methyltransferase Ste14
MESISTFVIVSCWLVFLVYWLIHARGVKTNARQKSFFSSLPYRLAAILGGALLWKPHWPQPLRQAITPQNDTLQLLACFVCIAGVAICIWARRTLAGNWSSNVTFKVNHELIKTGPYHFVRHPIYTGLLLMALANALQVGRLHNWLGELLWFISFWLKLKQEEQFMLQYFPDAYPAYKKEVKALMPFVI